MAEIHHPKSPSRRRRENLDLPAILTPPPLLDGQFWVKSRVANTGQKWPCNVGFSCNKTDA
jgi:hypothetical protein